MTTSSTLKHFPIDTIKIDRSFIADVDCNKGDAAITEAIIYLAHNLKMKVVAEGVEKPEQREFLRREGCDMMQGYLFSKPVAAEQFTQLLHSESEMTMARAA